jgi:chromosome segregation ATPase
VSEEKERLERQLATVTEKLKLKSAKYEELTKDFVKMESELKNVERERNELQVISQKREEEIQELYDTNSNISNQVPSLPSLSLTLTLCGSCQSTRASTRRSIASSIT